MLNLKYYADSLLPQEQATLVMRYFGFKKFKSLNSAQWFFKNQTSVNCSGGDNEAQILSILKQFGERLDDEQLSFEDKVELVLAECDWSMPEFNFLDVKGSIGSNSVTCICPRCQDNKERAWIPDKGSAKAIKCNHRTNCGFFGDFIKAYAEYYNKTYGEALNILADEFNVDLTVGEVHIGQKIRANVKPRTLTPKKPKEIQYMVFDKNRKAYSIDLEKFLDQYNFMNEEQQFKMIATAIYRFSLSTKQWGKEKYFKSVGISMKQAPFLKDKIKMIESKLGYLFKNDLHSLTEHLIGMFPTEDLVKYGVINGATDEDGKPHRKAYAFKQSVEEGLIVIPNFDMYTDMCSGLKYRKTKLKTWVDNDGNVVTDKNKEPEFSYGRIASPLPYHLTRQSLLDESISFRFFEGQKDLHSIPSKQGFCDVAIPGTNGISEEMLGLFKGRYIELYFDQDEEGQKGALKLKLLLEKAGAIVQNIIWSIELGGDVNEVLKSGNIRKIA